MATIEYWIQIENKPWDVCPWRFDRVTGQDFMLTSTLKSLISPITGATRLNVRMYKPLANDALILRRYTANWAAPDDRKVNPWDLNEPNPTDTGTMGTIPGPVIECNVGDQVIVHFRNHDRRADKPIQARAHSLHPHGFVFAPTSDGAYPLSPADPNQPVGGESAHWSTVGVTNFKKGDRVPPPIDLNDPNDHGGTFTYTWNTFGWPTTAGVWLYHDHAICDMENVQQGAIGIIVIHNSDSAKHTPIDPDDVVAEPVDLPGGSHNGSLIVCRPFPFPFRVSVLPHDLDRLGLPGDLPLGHAMTNMDEGTHAMVEEKPMATPKGKKKHEDEEHEHRDSEEDIPVSEFTIRHGEVLFELSKDLLQVARICIPRYRTPPNKALYLQLYHNLGDAMMCINGRKFLGNTPTLIAGVNTKMRFGVVGMGNIDGFHTFHLHGHRWIIPGPDGNSSGAIQNSSQITAVSQFEDTRTFGPANSFGFTINQGSFMGSVFTPDPTQAPGRGEWHMHCHVLTHMMDGMMGSLLVIAGGELAFRGSLPIGEPCPHAGVTILGGSFDPPSITVHVGETLRWTNVSGPHTVTSNPGRLGCNPPSAEVFDSNPGFPANPSDFMNTGDHFDHTFTTAGTYAYHCEVHGCTMSGTVIVM